MHSLCSSSPKRPSVHFQPGQTFKTPSFLNVSEVSGGLASNFSTDTASKSSEYAFSTCAHGRIFIARFCCCFLQKQLGKKPCDWALGKSRTDFRNDSARVCYIQSRGNKRREIASEDNAFSEGLSGTSTLVEAFFSSI